MDDDLSKIIFCFVLWILFSVIMKTLRQVAELAYLTLKEVFEENSDKNKQSFFTWVFDVNKVRLKSCKALYYKTSYRLKRGFGGNVKHRYAY